VVVPIYNVEKYLKECIDSLVNQTLKDIEIILVDDGSPDNSGKIVDQYAARDKRIVTVHQKNSGYSKAVNRGIAMAKGEYIGIVESDDWAESDMFERMYNNAKKNKTDVTKSLFFIYNSMAEARYQNSIWKNPCGIDLRLAPDEAFTVKEWPKIVGFHASIWSCIYRADFIKKIKIPETAGASYQDFPFMLETMCKARRISVVKHPFIHWRNEPNQGNSTSARGEKLLLMPQNTIRSLKVIKKYKLYDELKEPFFAHSIWANWDFFVRISWKYKRQYFKLMSELYEDLKNDQGFRYIYFRPSDVHAAQFFMKKTGLIQYIFHNILSKTKILIIKVATRVLPTYRVVVHLKEQIYHLEDQNELLLDEIYNLKNLK